MAAVRVPPSAWMTSQSIEICRSPSFSRSTTARRLRPISRWISWVRPDCLPADASRRVRSVVARGSIPYSAVIQPLPRPLSQGGRRSSRLAVHSTWVWPNLIRQEPSACMETARSKETRRSSSGLRFDGRMRALFRCLSGCRGGGRRRRARTVRRATYAGRPAGGKGIDRALDRAQCVAGSVATSRRGLSRAPGFANFIGERVAIQPPEHIVPTAAAGASAAVPRGDGVEVIGSAPDGRARKRPRPVRRWRP